MWEADIAPNANEVTWRVAEYSWLYVIKDSDRSGQTVVTIAVDDLDRSVAELADRGIASADGGYRTTASGFQGTSCR